MKAEAEARRGAGGLWHIFLDGREVALVTPMPWRYLAGVIATALAEGIDGYSKEEWQEKYREFVLRGIDD
jgi:hypothetical protein